MSNNATESTRSSATADKRMHRNTRDQYYMIVYTRSQSRVHFSVKAADVADTSIYIAYTAPRQYRRVNAAYERSTLSELHRQIVKVASQNTRNRLSNIYIHASLCGE
jgi:hypothetical protein